MPRIRSLKPSFFTDSNLSELPPLYRLAFQGLWCHADKAGRLEDKPRELKVQILPYDECDFESVLTTLARPKGSSPGFIQRYEAEGKRYIAITKFEDHQHPHRQEQPSEIPEPPELTVDAPFLPRSEPEQPPTNVGVELEQPPKLPGGLLSLGSGFLVLGAGNAEPAPAPTPDANRSMSAMDIPTVAAGALRERRGFDRPWVQPPGATIAPPDTPPEEWLGKDFWRWAQSVRLKAKLVPEKVPDERKLSVWWSGCLMTEGVTPKAMQRGFLRFGQSDHWEGTDPPYPFHAFMSQWDQFTRMEGGVEAHAS